MHSADSKSTKKKCVGGKCRNPAGRDAFVQATQLARKLREKDSSLTWQGAIKKAYSQLHNGGGMSKREQRKNEAAGHHGGGGCKKPCPKGKKNCTCDSKKKGKHMSKGKGNDANYGAYQ